MAFERDSRLASRLREGRFQILIEINSPPLAQPFDSALALGATMASRLAREDDVAAIAVTDRLRAEECHDPVKTAGVLMEASGKPILLHISGKGTDDERARQLLASARSRGIRSILALTGDRSDLHPLRKGIAGPGHYEAGYFESLDILRLAAGRQDGFFHAGAGVNPFKYNPADQYLQYGKMVRKIASGAEFIVTHAGWDMKKLQELQWFLAMRQISHPVIARVLLLSMEDIRTLEHMVFPGVYVPREFTAVLQRESDISATQSLAAQLPRIGLQAAGCRLLGYSGVQVAGIRDPQTLEMVLTRIRESLATYTSYDHWLDSWQEYHGDLSFAPVPNAYYVFRGLLASGSPFPDAASVRLTGRDLPRASGLDRLRGYLLPHLLSDRVPGFLSNVYRAVFRGGDGTSGERLRQCFYLDHRRCPKRLVYGACGGSTPEGLCEFGQRPCFFHRVIALASARHALDRLEEPVAHE